MRSPSTLTSTRSTPWVAGCWGPTLRTISSVCRAPGTGGWRRPAGTRSSGIMPSSQRHPGCGFFLVLGAGPVLEAAAREPERLAQRVTLAGLGQGEPDEVGGALGVDAEHLGALPLVPVGAAVDAREAGEGRVLGGQPHVGDHGG